jgi:hypothetical protein
MPVTRTSPAAAKIALFRSLFRGREEVYPRRFESAKTGKAGYSPVCGNEWVRGVCEKPRIKCSDCPHQHWLPLTDDVVRWHLSGKDDRSRELVAGVYPMLLDERCYFLAVDFDKHDWSADALAYLETCERLQIPAALERSRSGNGGHVWIFFDEAIPASLARKLGAHVLTETLERRPEAGLASYDRFFPNQDTLPRGGFGNLIALPLQKTARTKGNSLFVDARLVPYPDQWAFLSGVERMPKQRVEAIVREAEGRDRIVPVRTATPDDEDDPQPWKLTPSRRRDWMCCRISSMRRRPSCRLRCAMRWCGWRRSRIRSFSRRRRCVCRRTTSLESSPVRRTSKSTSLCRAAVSMMRRPCFDP